jgi:hypothetical protein
VDDNLWYEPYVIGIVICQIVRNAISAVIAKTENRAYEVTVKYYDFIMIGSPRLGPMELHVVLFYFHSHV